MIFKHKIIREKNEYMISVRDVSAKKSITLYMKNRMLVFESEETEEIPLTEYEVKEFELLLDLVYSPEDFDRLVKKIENMARMKDKMMNEVWDEVSRNIRSVVEADKKIQKLKELLNPDKLKEFLKQYGIPDNVINDVIDNQIDDLLDDIMAELQSAIEEAINKYINSG